jgi:hypothetical protein
MLFQQPNQHMPFYISGGGQEEETEWITMMLIPGLKFIVTGVFIAGAIAAAVLIRCKHLGIRMRQPIWSSAGW